MNLRDQSAIREAIARRRGGPSGMPVGCLCVGADTRKSSLLFDTPTACLRPSGFEVKTKALRSEQSVAMDRLFRFTAAVPRNAAFAAKRHLRRWPRCLTGFGSLGTLGRVNCGLIHLALEMSFPRRFNSKNKPPRAMNGGPKVGNSFAMEPPNRRPTRQGDGWARTQDRALGQRSSCAHSLNADGQR
jgi:hypothetical protein